MKAANNKLKYEKNGKPKNKLPQLMISLCMNRRKIRGNFGFDYARSKNLKKEQGPDLARRGLYSIFDEMNIENDRRYDWMDRRWSWIWDIRLDKEITYMVTVESNTNNNNVANNGGCRIQVNKIQLDKSLWIKFDQIQRFSEIGKSTATSFEIKRENDLQNVNETMSRKDAVKNLRLTTLTAQQ